MYHYLSRSRKEVEGDRLVSLYQTLRRVHTKVWSWCVEMKVWSWCVEMKVWSW